MLSSRITAADLAHVAGLSRHQLRSFMRELPGFSDPAECARIAREYTAQDLTVLVVCWELASRYGMKREVVGQLVHDIRRACTGPKTLADGARLLISVSEGSVTYLEKAERVEAGLVVPLDDLFQRIDQYLAQGPTPGGAQRMLNLGPVAVRQSGQKPVQRGASRSPKARSAK